MSAFLLMYPTLSSVFKMRCVVLIGISKRSAMVLILSSYSVCENSFSAEMALMID